MRILVFLSVFAVACQGPAPSGSPLSIEGTFDFHNAQGTEVGSLGVTLRNKSSRALRIGQHSVLGAANFQLDRLEVYRDGTKLDIPEEVMVRRIRNMTQGQILVLFPGDSVKLFEAVSRSIPMDEPGLYEVRYSVRVHDCSNLLVEDASPSSPGVFVGTTQFAATARKG